jgi:lipoate-protein ligase A
VGQPCAGAAVGWQLWVDEVPRPGWVNMAIDQTLLDRAEQHQESWLRLYQWQPHCLSFGRHEPALRRYDVDRIRELGLDTVRRPTGGRAVWHHREVTYSVAAPTSGLGSLPASYLEIHRMLAAALGELGLSPSLAGPTRTSPVHAGACFAQAAGGEVLIEGRKVIGSAQLRRGNALLQHGSILLEDDQSVVASLTRGAPADPDLKQPTSPLSPMVRGGLSPGDLIEAVARAAAARWRGAWQRVSTPGAVLNAAGAHFVQFQSPAWTWAR